MHIICMHNVAFFLFFVNLRKVFLKKIKIKFTFTRMSEQDKKKNIQI